MSSQIRNLFNQPLFDLGVVEAPQFSGVFSPRDELGTKREGVDGLFLERAEEYYRKYQGFDYWRGLIKQATGFLAIEPPSVIVAFTCGFGNATLPALDLFPGASVIATDISPNLLAILRQLLDARNLSARCIPVSMDAQKDY